MVVDGVKAYDDTTMASNAYHKCLCPHDLAHVNINICILGSKCVKIVTLHRRFLWMAIYLSTYVEKSWSMYQYANIMFSISFVCFLFTLFFSRNT